MKQCWAEEPSERPSFDEIAKTLRTFNKGKLVRVDYYEHVERVAWIGIQQTELKRSAQLPEHLCNRIASTKYRLGIV